MTTRQYLSQPIYDFIGSDEAIEQPALRASGALSLPQGISKDALIAELHAVKYELATLKEERERDKLQQAQELREAQHMLQKEIKEKEQERDDKNYLFERQTSLAQELARSKEESEREKEDMTRALRKLQTRNENQKEEMDELKMEAETSERRHAHKSNELQSLIDRGQLSLNQAHANLSAQNVKAQDLQVKLAEKEEELTKLQIEVNLARAQISDRENLDMLRREISEQIKHISSLENTARQQNTELNQLRDYRKKCLILEEQNRSLQSRVQVIEGLRDQLSNAEIQLSTLRAEKLAWSSFLHNDENDIHFTSPEQIVKMLAQERIERAALLEQFGRAGNKEAEHDRTIQTLEKNLSELQSHVYTLQESEKTELKVKQRLERQRTLALKEASFLREQLKNYVSEEAMSAPDHGLDPKTVRIQELESLLESHRNEISSLVKQLHERDVLVDDTTNNLSKRSRNDEVDAHEQAMGQISRKLRNLQEELDKTMKKNSFALLEIKSLQRRLNEAETAKQFRILQLKDNPTDQNEIVKREMLESLRKENADLLAQLQNQLNGSKLVPLTMLDNCHRDIKEMEKLVAEKEKRMMRLKEMWAKKALEFRQAVYSILGYEVDFQPNGRVKVKSMFHKSDFYGGIDTGIVFDGEQGTMKLSGGQNSQFAKEIKNALKFYVEERKEIPCFLAALTLEGYEKTTRANR